MNPMYPMYPPQMPMQMFSGYQPYRKSYRKKPTYKKKNASTKKGRASKACKKAVAKETKIIVDKVKGVVPIKGHVMLFNLTPSSPYPRVFRLSDEEAMFRSYKARLEKNNLNRIGIINSEGANVPELVNRLETRPDNVPMATISQLMSEDRKRTRTDI